MADNAAPAASSTANGGGETSGERGKTSRQSTWKPRGGDGGRGGRGGRGGGRGSGRGRGGRGGAGSRGRGDRNSKGNSKGEMGRGEYNRGNVDKRQRNTEWKAKKEGDNASHPFTAEELEAEKAEGRKPKRKVAVLIGYAGTGYKGMQINGDEKTIEGDIFKAFVAAGAISKANADDPKKSSLVRCARTDKGVHAAGNVISLKLIVEDPDVVKKINDALPPQIRVWGFERTVGAFSCYQSCDSRWYEYLIPTFAFIPPHPQSYLGKKLVESAKEEGMIETFKQLQEDIASFWPEAEEKYINPVLDKLDPTLREEVLAAIHKEEAEDSELIASKVKVNVEEKSTSDSEAKNDEDVTMTDIQSEAVTDAQPVESSAKRKASTEDDDESPSKRQRPEGTNETETEEPAETAKPENTKEPVAPRVPTPLETAIKEVKAAYITAKKAYRISDVRKHRVQESLQFFIGTRNFHNYTIQKDYKDPSANRVIRSFNVNPKPVYINDTEWLSIKVHGQSFMMHQIRKMIGMVSLTIRCGARQKIISESFGPTRISIPKAPGLGLLLERPVFNSYNQKAATEFQREKIDFDKFIQEIDEFKQREIYDRIFREEEESHQFAAFYHHLDHFRSEFFLWLTAAGLKAAKAGPAKGEIKKRDLENDSDDERPDAKGEEG